MDKAELCFLTHYNDLALWSYPFKVSISMIPNMHYDLYSPFEIKLQVKLKGSMILQEQYGLGLLLKARFPNSIMNRLIIFI